MQQTWREYINNKHWKPIAFIHSFIHSSTIHITTILSREHLMSIGKCTSSWLNCLLTSSSTMSKTKEKKTRKKQTKKKNKMRNVFWTTWWMWMWMYLCLVSLNKHFDVCYVYSMNEWEYRADSQDMMCCVLFIPYANAFIMPENSCETHTQHTFTSVLCITCILCTSSLDGKPPISTQKICILSFIFS